jgi:hypothetical protein
LKHTYVSCLGLNCYFPFLGELLVIVEYCRFGNLQKFLINHRNKFINLVDEFGNLKMQEEIESNNFTRYRSSLIVICGVIKKFN